MVVTNNKYSITACPGDQVLPIAQSGSRQTRPRITGIYSKSILPTPKYRHRQGYPLILVSLFLPPLFCRHYHCRPFFLLCHPQRGNGAPWPRTIYCVDWPPDTLTDGRCLSRVDVTTRTHLAETLHSSHQTLHISHCILHSSYCILHSSHCTMYSSHCILHSSHCILYSSHCILGIFFCVDKIPQLWKWESRHLNS